MTIDLADYLKESFKMHIYIELLINCGGDIATYKSPKYMWLNDINIIKNDTTEIRYHNYKNFPIVVVNQKLSDYNSRKFIIDSYSVEELKQYHNGDNQFIDGSIVSHLHRKYTQQMIFLYKL